MKRKLIKQGLGGFTISMPVKWVKRHGLGKGDEVDLQEIDDNIKISAEQHDEMKEITLEASSNERLLQAKIWQSYYQGYDRIIINYTTEAQKKRIIRTKNMALLGFEITKQDKNRMILENITGPSAEKQDILQRRTFFIVKETLELIESDLKAGKPKNKERIETLSPEVLKYTLFCQRNIAKRLTSPEHIRNTWEVQNQVSGIQGRARLIYVYVKDFKASPKTVNILHNLRNAFENIYKGFYTEDLKSLEKAESTLLSTREELVKQLENTKGPETTVLFYLGEISRAMFLLDAAVLALMV
ncbi:AbrB/MazE/SpoVT family DNA-binding domain-containing protein [Thermoproteota archaeon]